MKALRRTSVLFHAVSRPAATPLLFCTCLLTTLSFAGVTVTSPTNDAIVSSPTQFAATASSAYPITAFQIYVDNNLVLTTGNQLNTFVNLPSGWHYVVVQAWDSSGNYYKSPISLNVTTQTAEARDIEKMSGWQWCTATFNGQPCASGLGDAVSWMAQYQNPPSLDGASSHFFIGGPIGYSNALWWKSLGSAWNVNHLQYDFWVFLEDPSVSRALEFDVNIATGGTRWVFGTECNFKDTKRWDVWDGGRGVWVPTDLGCAPFTANSWNHFTWNFERVDSRVHYISLVINDITYPVDVYLDAQPNYGGSDINVAFQMDGDYRQDSYGVWLNQMSLLGW